MYKSISVATCSIGDAHTRIPTNLPSDVWMYYVPLATMLVYEQPPPTDGANCFRWVVQWGGHHWLTSCWGILCYCFDLLLFFFFLLMLVGAVPAFLSMSYCFNCLSIFCWGMFVFRLVSLHYSSFGGSSSLILRFFILVSGYSSSSSIIMAGRRRMK